MRRPRYITINSDRWRITWKSYLGHDGDGAEFLGRCYHDQKEIHIKSTMAPDLTAEVLLHEMEHAHHEHQDEDRTNSNAAECITALQKCGLVIAEDE